MSKTTEMLEAAVAEVIAYRPAPGEAASARQRARIDRAFARVLKIVAPRIRHFIKQYGLTGHWEDAEQVCAIAVHRAIEAYDPGKAMFTTFVNWQIRGELQGLRFRLMDDQRPSARKVEATTVSLHALEHGTDGEEISLEAMLVDENAHSQTEAGASDHLAALATKALMNEYVRHLRNVGIAQIRRKARTTRTVTPRAVPGTNLPKFVHTRPVGLDMDELNKLEERIARDKEIVATYLFSHPGSAVVADELEKGLTKERIRQITRRAARVMADLASDNPRFAGMPGMAQENDDAPSPHIDIHPAAGQGHNRIVRIGAPDSAGDNSLPTEADETAEAEILLRYGGARH